MNEWCVKQHGATGLTQRCRESNILCQVRLGLEASYFVKYSPVPLMFLEVHPKILKIVETYGPYDMGHSGNISGMGL